MSNPAANSEEAQNEALSSSVDGEQANGEE
jgi:hypothetical protein